MDWASLREKGSRGSHCLAMFATAQDATFCPTTGNSGQGYSFQSVNYTNKYIRHFNFTAYIASNGGSNAWDSATSWAADTSWLSATPWA